MVIPVVVDMRVASVIDRAPRAAVEVETARRPRRDTGETLLKFVDLRVSGRRAAVNPSCASFLRQTPNDGAFDLSTLITEMNEADFFS